MKGNLPWACVLVCWLPLGAAGQVIMNGGIMNFNGAIQYGGNATAKAEVMPETRTDLLEFVDGSVLHGQFSRMDVDHGLAWVAPEAKSPISFRPDHVNFIRFAHSQDVRVSPSCHLRFGNGDDLYGSISTLDNQRLGFKTWFGGDIAVPRPALRSISFLSSNYAVAYDGPYDAGGWTLSPEIWSFHDGAFVGTGSGGLGRDLGLTNSVTVEFDLAWSGSFNLQVCLYCDIQDRLDATGGACAVYLTPRQITLRQAQNMGGVFNPAAVPLALEAGATRLHAAIQCDKTEGTVSVFVNNQLIKIWKDCDFSGAGTGILFVKNFGYFNFQNGYSFGNGGTVRLSRLTVSQWQGRCEAETFSSATNADAVHFINHDRAAGKIQSIQDGKIKLALGEMNLEIPLARVAEIDFAETNAAAELSSPWVARAHFPGGGSLSFQLEKWDDRTISGRSAIFGPLALQSAAVREIEFNLDRPRENNVTAAAKEFEELDE